MSRIELGPVPVKVVQCQFCGRVRFGAEWVHDDAVKVDVIGTCATCGEWQARLARIRERRQHEAVEAKKRRGFGPAPEGSDPFAGFREGE